MSDNHYGKLGVQSYWGPLGDSIEHASASPCLSSKEGVYSPILVCYCFMVPAGSVSKEPACNAGDPDSMHGSWNGNPLEKEIATHSSVLAWSIPGTGEPGGLLSMGSHRVRHDWSNLAAAAAATHNKKYAFVSVNIKLVYLSSGWRANCHRLWNMTAINHKGSVLEYSF